MAKIFSLYTTEERISLCDSYVKSDHYNQYNAISDVINSAIDLFHKINKQNILLEFITHIGTSMFLFLVGVGLTLYLPLEYKMFFFGLTVFAGVYLAISFFIFYNKYKGVKWQ